MLVLWIFLFLRIQGLGLRIQDFSASTLYAFPNLQFCIINPLIPILCVLRQFEWVQNMKNIIDNTGANVVILICWSLGVLCRKQRILEVPERKAGRQHTFCFYAVGTSTVFLLLEVVWDGYEIHRTRGFSIVNVLC